MANYLYKSFYELTFSHNTFVADRQTTDDNSYDKLDRYLSTVG